MGTGDLSGRIAVVTGASRGIGRAIALGLSAEGALVCAIGRDAAALREVANAAPSSRGGRVLAYRADLASEAGCRRVAESILRDQGGADILVLAAGQIEFAPLAESSAEAFDRQYAVNVRAPFALARAFQTALAERHGQIVFINSSAGIRASPNNGQYAATKHALRGLADSLREEINDQGVRVLSVFPGRTATPMQARVHEYEGRAYDPEGLLQPDDVASMVIASLRLPMTAEVTDIMIRPRRRPSPG